MTLIAFDPGLHNPALAVFQGGVLVYASRVKVPTALKSTKLSMGTRCVGVAQEALKVLQAKFPDLQGPVTLVVEWPKVYRGTKAKGDPADLLPLAGTGIALASLLTTRYPGLEIFTPIPFDWTGNLPKATKGDPRESVRGVRVWSRLSERERECVVLSHDAIDAIGIGLWKLGRFERRRVFPGATS